jgi:hypothetical protein
MHRLPLLSSALWKNQMKMDVGMAKVHMLHWHKMVHDPKETEM